MTTKPCAAAIAWAEKNKFSIFAGNQAVIEAYAAHLRILSKIAARKA